jgi:8-oxo-dGTP pyrophosphatase MutT (NUDIX family)
MFEELIFNLKEQIKKPLPNNVAHQEMAHANRVFPNINEVSSYKPSAVIILLYPNIKNEPCVLLIERSTYNGHHSGQIALPGGKKETIDLDLQATALREFFEETGSNISPNFIGKLSDIYIPVSNFMVQPYLAYATTKPNFEINVAEVNKVIEWLIHDLLNQKINQATTLLVNNTNIITPYFLVEDKILWGATAMILNELKHIIKNA